MSSDDQAMVARRGGGRVVMSYMVPLTMAAGVTANDLSFTPPPDSRVSAMRVYVPVAFTGSPTNINLTVGKTSGGTDYVAAVDIKAANATTALTLVAAADYQSWPTTQPVCVRIAAVGGTNPAGTAYVEITYHPPNP